MRVSLLTQAVVASSSYEYMSRLKWYLPMSADPNLTLTRSANHLIIENENSIAGIKFEDGTYEYNTTFHEETACSACSGDKFYTLSKNGSFGIWNGENGSGLEWNKVIDGSVDYCKISFLSRHKYGFLVNNKQMIVTDLNGKIAWTWNDKEVARTWSEVLVGVDEVTLIGRNDTTICWIDIDVKYGNVSKKLCKNALIDSDIFITGENSDFAVWVAASGHIEGVYLPDGQYLNFPEARADMSEFNEAPKTIIKLDSPDLFRSVLVVNYGVGKEILLSVADEASNLAVAYIPVVDTGSQNLYLYRDANYEINTLGRIYADKSNSNVNVFELIDPLSGEIIQQTELEPVFSGRPIRGFLDTKMSEDGYFTWIVIGLDDAGGFFFHKPYYGEEHNPVRPAGDISEELAPEEHSEEL